MGIPVISFNSFCKIIKTKKKISTGKKTLQSQKQIILWCLQISMELVSDLVRTVICISNAYNYSNRFISQTLFFFVFLFRLFWSVTNFAILCDILVFRFRCRLWFRSWLGFRRSVLILSLSLSQTFNFVFHISVF